MSGVRTESSQTDCLSGDGRGGLRRRRATSMRRRLRKHSYRLVPSGLEQRRGPAWTPSARREADDGPRPLHVHQVRQAHGPLRMLLLPAPHLPQVQVRLPERYGCASSERAEPMKPLKHNSSGMIHMAAFRIIQRKADEAHTITIICIATVPPLDAFRIINDYTNAHFIGYRNNARPIRK